MTACPSCEAENRADARFCDSCGAVLEPVAAPVREERKIVSVLFCDLVGFTAESEQADPEDVRARLRPYHQLLRERIEAYGGVVEKFIGDAVMAVFGAPVAHEDDAERAVRAGLSILESLEELGDTGATLDVRIGVNTGEALVSLDARPEQGEGMVTGDVVNTAARIQTSAPVNGVAVGEGTYRATQRVFEWEVLEPIHAKGKSAPVAVRRPLRPVARFGSDVIRTHTTAFVGREVERSLLGGLLDRAVRDRTVQLVTVVGEPGVGKSRQVAELLSDVDRRTELVRWRQGRCLPYGDGIAFWALGEIVKAHAGIFESDTPEITRGKLRAVLPDGDEGAWLEERLLPLVGLEAATVNRAESFSAWRTFLESIADRDPTVLVVEDLHWADLVLLDFLEHLVEHASGVPLFVVATARPELADRAPGWAGGLRNATTITLNPLSETETARLVSGLLEQTLLPADLQRAIIDRSGGNPLYAEEVVRLLRDRGLLDDPAALADLPLPETVHALIAARLDTLSPERKGLLQDASVLGKVFWSGAVAAIGGTSQEQVAAGLHELERRELIRPSRTTAVEGHRELAFWHALVRDVAYGQIPRPQRAQKHVAAADWLEESAGGRIEDVAELLAHHLGEAVALFDAVGERPRAEVLRPRVKRALVLAAERAVGLDPSRAVAHLDRALELVSDDSERLELVVRRAYAAIQAGRVQEAARALDEVLPALRAGPDAVLTASALSHRSLVSRHIGEEELLVPLAQEAVTLLESSGPSRPLLDAMTELSGALTVRERLEDAVALADQTFALADELGVERPARLLGFRGTQRFFLGDTGGLDDMDEAYERLVASGASRFATVVRFNRARALWHVDGPKSFVEFLEARDFALSRGQELSARYAVPALAFALRDQGRYDEVIALVDRHLPEIDAIGDVFAGQSLRSWLAAIYVATGDLDAADRELRRVLEGAVGERRGHALTFAAPVARMRGEQARAAELFTELLGTNNVHAHPPSIGNLPLIARTAAGIGETRRAAEYIDGIYPGFGFRYIDTLATAARAVLAHAEGDHERAADLASSAVDPLAEALAFPERGHALLLLGQARIALGDSSGLDDVRSARDVFAELGMRPALAEAEALLEGEVAAEA